MMKDEKASLSIRKITFMAVVLIFSFSIGVFATNTQVSNIKIILSNHYEMNVLTTKTKVADILDESHIVMLPEENVVPDKEAQIGDNKVITITKQTEGENSAVALANEDSKVTMEQILGDYTPVVEKIITEQEVIPFETITKNIANNASETTNKVVTEGIDGLKEIVYRAKFKNNVEIDRTLISETIIKEPVNKVVQVKKTTVTSRSSTTRTNETKQVANNPATKSTSSLAKKVEGKNPIVKKFNTSAYCACKTCCGKTTGITTSGAKASAWYTIAAGKGYPIGTIIYIPYFKNQANGGWFVVQDRGGAISNNKIDVFMGSHNQAIQFGRRTLECYVYM